jgi:hypothetical protein
MPLQNRVTPWGDIVALPERGLFMGNRGCLHDGHRRVVKSWARAPWVTCLLQFGGRHRAVMAPGQYTELFFLDEATALAAGHRPCATCRRADYDRFKALWLTANADLAAATDRTMAAIDRLLHAERVDAGGRKLTWSARLRELPDGAMVAREGTRGPLLVQGGALHPWTPAGYGPPQKASPDMRVQVLTPPSVVKVLARGYRPVVHPSVGTPVAMPVPPTSARTAPVSEPAADRLPPETTRAPPLAGCKPEPPANTAVNSAGERLYRLEKTPSGKALCTYFAAILIATGMDKEATYPLKKFLKNFSGHEQAGRIEKVPGGYRLTRAGRDYFADRYQFGNPQHVDRREVDAMLRLIRTGQAAGWVAVA